MTGGDHRMREEEGWPYLEVFGFHLFSDSNLGFYIKEAAISPKLTVTRSVD